MKRHSLFLLSTLFLTSCADLHTGRTYLSEMEHESGRFFDPQRDFPVVHGDTGEIGISEEERRSRTPASLEEIEERSYARVLHEELRELESSQSEGSEKQYEAHKHQLATTSEKIYFLKLSPSERTDYLESRGFLETPKDKDATEKVRFGVRQNKIMQGMSKTDVIESVGRPLRVDVAGNPSFENERWAYKVNGDTKFIYFEAGEVQGWE